MKGWRGGLVPKYSIVTARVLHHDACHRWEAKELKIPTRGKTTWARQAEAGAHAGSLSPHPTTSTGGSSSPNSSLPSWSHSGRKLSSVGPWVHVVQIPIGWRKEGTDYLLKHNRVLHNLVVSLFGMEVMELTRCLTSASRRLSPSEKKNTKTSNYQDSGIMTTDTAVSEGKRDDPLSLHHGQCRWATWCQRGAPKRQRLRIERQDLKDLISHIRTISTDTYRAQGPLIKQCLSPAQAPVQKQQPQAACSSACLTLQCMMPLGPVLKWLGSSGPQSQPAASETERHTQSRAV